MSTQVEIKIDDNKLLKATENSINLLKESIKNLIKIYHTDGFPDENNCFENNEFKVKITNQIEISMPNKKIKISSWNEKIDDFSFNLSEGEKEMEFNSFEIKPMNINELKILSRFNLNMDILISDLNKELEEKYNPPSY